MITLEAATVGLITVLFVILGYLLKEKFKEVAVAKKKADDIEVNYLIRFDRLHKALSEIKMDIIKDNAKVKEDILAVLNENRLEYFKLFALKSDCEKIHDKLNLKIEGD